MLIVIGPAKREDLFSNIVSRIGRARRKGQFGGIVTLLLDEQFNFL
jgi:hypothetical protein